MTTNISRNEILSKYTSLQVGGTADYFVEINSEGELEEVVTYAKEHELSIAVLGGGSNILVSDGGVDGLVVKMNIQGVSASVSSSDEVLVVASAGETLDDVVAYTVAQGYWGLENLSHIPGTVGAAPVQNVGAYGLEVKDIIHSVRVYDTELNVFTELTNHECLFEYRDSLFKKNEGGKYIVVSVTFSLHTSVTPVLSYTDLQNRFTDINPSLSEIRQAIIEIRSKKFPDWQVVGTAGSFFKNPVITNTKFQELRLQYPDLPGFPSGEDEVKISLGWVLDKVLDMKGAGTEKVGTYKGQALVLINKGGATSEDFVSFAEEITQKVHDVIGVKIQWEVTKVGFEV